MAPAISKPLLSDLEAQIGKVPSSHIRPVGDRPDLADVDESGAGIPLIDLKKLNGPERPKVVEAIGRACESDGFFMVTNHGIPAAVVEGMLRVAREFFHLPESERLKCYSDDPKKAIRLSTSFNVRTEKVLELLPVDLMDMSLAADTKSQERGASWISAAISSGSALPRWLRKFKLGGSSSSSLLPVVAPSQQQPTHWESHSPGTRGFAAGAPRPSSQRRSSAAAESTSNSVSEILQGGSASGSFTPPPSLTSASSSPSRDTATRTPSPTTGKNAAADATDSGGEPPVGTRRSGSPPGPTDPPATAASSVATTTVNDDAMKVLIAMIPANSAINMALVVNMKDITSSWETQWEVLYAIFMMFSVLSTVTSIFTAVSPADSRARRFSSFCVRLGLLLATALFFVSITCQLGHSGCIAGVPTAAVLVIFLAVLWWKYC